MISIRTVYEPDLWYHLAQGREAAGGHLVRTNTFSFNYPEYPQSFTAWLFDLAAYLAWKAGEGLGIQLLQLLLVATTLALVYLACRVRSPVSAALAVLALGFFVLEPRAIPRPHLVSFAGLAACSLSIERARRTRSAAPLRWAIPVVALWSNLHVESVFGAVLVGAFAVGEWIRPSVLERPAAVRAFGVATACAGATLLNPYGWGLERYLFENTRMLRLVQIAELQRPYLPDYTAFFTYVVVAATLIAVTLRRLAAWEALVALASAALGFAYLRFTPIVFIVTAPILADRLGRFIARGLDGRAAVAIALAAGVIFARQSPGTLASQVRAGTDAVRPWSFFSPGAAAFARRAGLRGSVFNSNNLGGYLAWELYPDARVFQDSRFQAYPEEHIRAIVNASRSQEEWNALVAAIDWAVRSIPRANELSGAGRFPSGEWATVYWDEAVEVLVRRAGRFGDVAASHEYTVLRPGSDLSVLAPQLAASDRLRAEAARNRRENPHGFLAAAVLCLDADASACAAADRMGEERPELAAAAEQLRHMRRTP